MLLPLVIGSLLVGQAQVVSEARCLDTWLDKAHPTANYGRDMAVAVGPGATGLLKFPLVAQSIPRGTRVVDARLVLRGPRSATVEVGLAGADWVEGGGVGAKGSPKAWANWNIAAQTHVSTALKGEREGDELVVRHLGDWVKRWVGDPAGNHGLVVRSSQPEGFASSESGFGPRLEIEVEKVIDGPDLAVALSEPNREGWRVTVVNLGAAASPTLVWTEDGVARRIPLGDVGHGTARVVNVPSSRRSLDVRVEAPDDVDVSNNHLSLSADWKEVRLGADPAELVEWQRTFKFLNDWALPRSRSRAFPDGGQIRLRAVAGGQGGLPGLGDRPRELLKRLLEIPPALLADGQPRPGLGWGTDTRDDSVWHPALPLPAQGATAVSSNANQLTDPKLLGIADVYLLSRLGQPLPPPPDLVVFRASDQVGDPLVGAEVQAVGPDGKSLATTTVATAGSFAFSRRTGALPSAAQPWVDYRLSRAGETAVHRLCLWDSLLLVARSGTALGTYEMRVPLPSVPVDRGIDVAQHRIVTDEAGRKPAELDSVVDGDDSTTLSLDSSAGRGWVEIDLGKDRPVAAVELAFRGSVPEVYAVAASVTGSAEQSPWLKEEFGAAQVARWGVVKEGVTTVRLFARVRRMRKVRVSVGAGHRAELAAVRVFGMKGA